MKIAAIVAVLLVASLGLRLYAAEPTKADKPVRVLIKKTDGTTVAGEMVEADRHGISVRKTVNDEAMLVPWEEIGTVSNKLTRETAIAKWKEKHAAELCETCKGDGEVAHADCKGSGVDPAKATPCLSCKGLGSTEACPTKGCVEGKVDCPGPCLKLSVGKWEPGPEGKTIRKFNIKGGTSWVSSGHLGQIWVVEKGALVDKGICPQCKGTAKVEDAACHGTGKKACEPCHGAGVVGDADPGCREGKIDCDTCKGAGLKA